MKYIIYGINRTAKDFTYIFDDLEILYLIDDNVEPGKVSLGQVSCAVYGSSPGGYVL